MEQAGPTTADYSSADLKLLALPQYRSLRGAAADEPRGSEAWQRRAVANALRTDYYRKREGSIYRIRDGLAPGDRGAHLCVALSGGGMRSLAFSAGVLHSLEQRGLIARTDVISSVSGGGLTTYWLDSAVAHGTPAHSILADVASPPLTYLRHHSNELVSLGTRLTVAALALQPSHKPMPADFSFRHWDLLLQAGGNIDIKDNGWNRGYAARLDRMLSPSTTLSTLFSADTGLHSQQLRDIVTAGLVPVPVWLTAARAHSLDRCVPQTSANELRERSRRLTYAAFEFSTFDSGSEELGMLAQMIVEPHTAMAASTAAMNVPFNEHCRLYSLISASLQLDHFPSPYVPDKYGPRPGPYTDPAFDLLDGGIADNLAIFPLVRRMCSDIVVVDAEFDPYLTFEGYGYLKQQLAALDIALDVPELEAVAAHNRVPPAPNNAAVPCKDGICLIRPKPECVRREIGSGCIAPDELATSVFEGQIGPIPMAMKTAEGVPEAPWAYEERTLRVHYVKLSLDGDHIDQYPATVRERYRAQATRREHSAPDCVANRSNGACSFPHEPTADLDYRHGQFEAYWDLGRCIIERQWAFESTRAPYERCLDSEWPDPSRR